MHQEELEPIWLVNALLLKLCLCGVSLSSTTSFHCHQTGQVNKKEKKKETGYTDDLSQSVRP